MNIAILFGGSSFEHEISIVSAITMKKVLKRSNITYIYVDQSREFYLIDTQKINSKLFSSGEYKKNKKLTLKHGGFFIDGMLKQKRVEYDTLLNLIHGRDGEDAKIASLMEFFGISYISPRIEASVLSYNKLYTKLFAQSIGVKSVEYQHLRKENRDNIQIEPPFIVKPVRLGSSIGVSVVKSMQELEYALDVAFEFDSDVIIEPFLEGIKEYNLAGCFSDRWELSIIEEPQKNEFLDFEKKYMDFSRDSRATQAQIGEEIAQKIEDAFKKIYDPLFRGSIIRCDFFEKDAQIYLNEINPIPGSMANYLFNDFESTLHRVVANLPREQKISVDFQYIHSIQSAKGKA